MSTFEENRVAELPAFSDGPIGLALARAIGRTEDLFFLPLAREAALSRWPYWCPDDALDATGSWYKLERYEGEPDGTAPTTVGGTDGTGYRGRLCVAWPTWEKGGTKSAIINSIKAWGVPDVVVLNDYEVSPPWPGSWYTRFEVDLGPDFGAYGWAAGNDPTLAQQQQLQRQVLRWKWSYGYPVKIVLRGALGYTFTIVIGPIIGDGFIIGKSHIGGFDYL